MPSDRRKDEPHGPGARQLDRLSAASESPSLKANLTRFADRLRGALEIRIDRVKNAVEFAARDWLVPCSGMEIVVSGAGLKVAGITAPGAKTAIVTARDLDGIRIDVDASRGVIQMEFLRDDPLGVALIPDRVGLPTHSAVVEKIDGRLSVRFDQLEDAGWQVLIVLPNNAERETIEETVRIFYEDALARISHED